MENINMKKIKRFTASWCAPCKALAMIIDSMEIDVPIEVIDIDNDMDLAISNNVRSVPTLIMFEDDKEIKRHTGTMTEAQLNEWINKNGKE
jgi:thioredoxin 1